MKTSRNLAIVAFVSLGLNVFLGGVLAGKMMRHGHAPTDRTTAAPAHIEGDPEGARPKAQKAQPPTAPGEVPPNHRGPKADPKGFDRHGPHGHHHESDHGPDGRPADLVLLRRMIRVMGGPKDPRIARLREERKDEIARIRNEMSSAHKLVQEALTAEKPDDGQLREALKNLRKTAFEAQARAQEGILTLAQLMTEEERARLREQGSQERREKPRFPADVKKPAP